MTAEEKMSMLAAMVGADVESDAPSLLAYVTIAGQKVLNRCYPFGYDEEEVVPTRYDALQCEIAAYLWNKRGAEGQTSHSENGISRGYESGDVPESLMGQITPRGVVF